MPLVTVSLADTAADFSTLQLQRCCMLQSCVMHYILFALCCF